MGFGVYRLWWVVRCAFGVFYFCFHFPNTKSEAHQSGKILTSSINIFAFAFVVSLAVLLLFKPVAYCIKLAQGEQLSRETNNAGLATFSGGLAIFVSVLTTVLLFLDQTIFIRLFLLASSLIVFMGVVDDSYQLSVRFRLMGQLLICSIFTYGLDLPIHTFGNILGFVEIKTGLLGYPLSVLSLMGAINAFKMLDGIKGLAGSLALLTFAGLVVLFGVNGDVNLLLLCVIFVGAIVAFLLFNVWQAPNIKHTNKKYMGDAGSTLLGLVVGVLLVQGSHSPSPAFTPITALWLVLLPMVDMLVVVCRRVSRGRSAVVVDNTNIYHLLLRVGFSSITTLGILFVVQLVFVVLAVAASAMGVVEPVLFLILLGVVVLYLWFLRRMPGLMRWGRRRVV
jgi:UDP-GlcNAc:undecaprenyl-phosphate GlcNAc-1-phosphate transferase